jgi:hypothetical protein
MNFKLETPADAPFRKNVYILQIRQSSSIALHRVCDKQKGAEANATFVKVECITDLDIGRNILTTPSYLTS